MPGTRSMSRQEQEKPESEEIVSNVSEKHALPTLPKRRLIVLPDSLKTEELRIVTLPHPRSGTQALFCVDNLDHPSEVFELIQHKEQYRAWFLDDSLEPDGSLILTAPINVLFLILPHLIKTQTMYKTLDDLLTSGDAARYSSALMLLERLEGLDAKMDRIADSKDISGEKVYKYSQSKTFEWLEDRLNKLTSMLRNDTFVSPVVLKDADATRRYAFGILCDYVPDSLQKELKAHFRIKDPVPTMFQVTSPSKGKKRKREEQENAPTEDYYRQDIAAALQKSDSAPVKLTPTQKQLQKASTGTKSLSSFFKKK